MDTKNHLAKQIVRLMRITTSRQAMQTFFSTTVPVKDLHYYKQYFNCCRAISALHHHDSDLYFLSTRLILFLAYLALLHLGFYFLSFATSTLFTFSLRLLLVDSLFIMSPSCRAHSLYLIQTGLILYCASLHWMLYFRANSFNAFLEDALFGTSSPSNSKKTGKNKTSKIHSLNAMLNQANFRRQSLFITNQLQGFITAMDLCVGGFFVSYAWTLYHHAPLVFTQIHAIFNHFFSFLCGTNLLALYSTSTLSYLLLLFLTVPATLILLFHLLLFTTFWTLLAHNTSFFASFGVVCLLYLHCLFREHYRQLGRVLANFSSNSSRKANFAYRQTSYSDHLGLLRQLQSNLQQNLHLFRLLFAGDHFFGPLFLVYLTLYLPLSAYFPMIILLGQIDSLLMRFGLLVLCLGALLGSLAVHLCIAHISGHVHRGGRMLTAFTARNCLNTRRGKQGNNKLARYCFPPRMALSIHFHIARLLVRRKYGVCYGGKCWLTITTTSFFVFC